ncbi:ABC transporter permease [Clostridium isatidis]|uniref:ABC transporter permease n=1 Tax=Clostridium isatidis TaxID=182773 RepID=UPI0017911DA3|nr:ABC transporter permease [Clostridiales bacterium]
MKNILVLIKNNLRISIVKNPVGFLVSLLAPVLIFYIMMSLLNFNSGYIKVGLVDKDNSKTSKNLVEFIKNYEGFTIQNINQDNINNLFAEGNIDLVIEIDSSFEENLINGLVKGVKIRSLENRDTGKAIIVLLNQEITNLKSLTLAAEGNKEAYHLALDNYNDNSYIKLQRKNLNDLYGDYTYSQIFVGFIVMFMLIRGMVTSSRVFMEKKENVYNRIFMAPVKTYEYYLADAISGYVIVLIQVILGVLGIKLLKINMGFGYLELIIILSIFGLVSISLGILCRSFSKNHNEASNIFNFFHMIFIMIGGAFVPLDIMPPIIEKISYFTPVRWVIEAIISMQQGASLVEIYKYLAIILLFAVTFFIIGTYNTSKEEKKTIIN